MNQIFAICRLGKVSGWGAISAMGEHHTRARPTLNADPKRPPVRLIGNVAPDIDVLGIKPRSNAVLAVEHLLTASPEHFRPGRPDAYGEYEMDRIKPWLNANIRWLAKRYGQRLVSATLHLDEATPHIHAVVVPVEKKLDRRTKPPSKRWGLNARGLVGGAQKLRDLQDDYARAMAPLGLQRGVEKASTG